MPNWKIFEKNATKYLNSNIKLSGISFLANGESDSNASDIEVLRNEQVIFSIECKYSPAQSSQFVVKKLDNKFFYSEANRSNQNGSAKIIEHMNENFSYYSRSVGSVNLICDKNLMYERVIQQLSSKSIFFIAASVTENFSSHSPIVIDRVERLDQYFDISGVYRHKRSGTSYAKQADLAGISSYLKFGDKFYVHDPHNKLPAYPPLNSQIYMPDSDEKGYRVIKKRSNTNNRNVIFTLKLKDSLRLSNLNVVSEYILNC
jgi:hypothetical protein